MTIARYRTTVMLLGALALTACGGGGGGGDTTPPPGGNNPPPPGGNNPPATFSIGGTVTGLAATGLVLQNNGGNDLAISASGAFIFSTPLASGVVYAVTVKTQPNVGPAQNCTVSNAGGTINAAAVSNITVTCTTQVGKFIYVPNSGSNDVSAYSINATTGALTAVAGSPFAADQNPSLVSADAAGTSLYVSNRGSVTAPPRFSAYSINATTGALTEVAASPFDLSTPPPPNGAVFIGRPMIHPSGAFGYVGLVDSGQLYGATVNATTGELIEIPGMPITVGVKLTSGTFNSAGTVLYLPHDNHNGLPAGGVSALSVNAPSGVLTPISSYSTGGRAPTIAVLSPGGKFLLTPNLDSGSVAVFAVDATSGTLTPAAGSPFSTGAVANPSSLAVHPSKNFVYATDTNGVNPSSIAAFQVDATTGVLTAVPGSPFPTNGTAALLGSVDPSGKFFYVTNRASNTIQGFAIDQTTGALTSVPGSPFATELVPSAAVIDPSGKYVYCPNSGSNSISAYAINATTGALTLINTVPAGLSPGFAERVGLQ